MTQRIDYMKQAPAPFKKMIELGQSIHDSSIGATIRHLVAVRASQINGCGFCLDMHIKQAAIDGERPLRLHHLASWRESTLFEPRERAALAWTEALTTLSPLGVPDEIYDRVRGQFSEKELTELTYEITTINAWNRVNVAFRPVPGSYDKAFGLDKSGLA